MYAIYLLAIVVLVVAYVRRQRDTLRAYDKWNGELIKLLHQEEGE